MNTVVTLSGQETAERLLPVLRDYAAKLAVLNERAAALAHQMSPAKNAAPEVAVDAARLVCLRDTLDRPVRDIAQSASGLLEHSELEYIVWAELKLRLDEMEEHYRFSKAMVAILKDRLTALTPALLEQVRKLVELTRHKSPF